MICTLAPEHGFYLRFWTRDSKPWSFHYTYTSTYIVTAHGRLCEVLFSRSRALMRLPYLDYGLVHDNLIV
jgi:hypothetical protein